MSSVVLYAYVDRSKGLLWGGLSMGGPHQTYYFKSLFAQRSAIESEFGAPLDWEGLESNSYVSISLPVDVEDRADWAKQHRWLVEQLSKTHRVLVPRIRALHAQRERPD
jgi:hypothetical protein